jgi:MFS family permease
MTAGSSPILLLRLLLPGSASADAGQVILGRALRAFADGFVAILLPIYLLKLGYGTIQIGILTTATLLGSAAMTLLVGFLVRWQPPRRLLIAASAMMAIAALGFTTATEFWPLLLVASLGTVNVVAGDVSVFLPLEHAVLAGAIADKDRTSLFARYGLTGALFGALGTLAAAAPDHVPELLGIGTIAAMQAMFVLHALLAIAAGLAYARIKAPAKGADTPHATLGPSRGIVYRLATLFCVDSFGGGFAAQSILAAWLFGTFGLSVTAAATLFFWSNLLTAVSQLAAPPLARRIGLINTMVFTHIPANLCIAIVPFVDDLAVVVALLMFRALLSQMDVPTRSSYVMAVVTPQERPAAASVTSIPRSLASALSPSIAGWLLSVASFAWPLLLCGGLKIVYDFVLLAMFRRVKPPEEEN